MNVFQTKSHRVKFVGGCGEILAGIVDHPVLPSSQDQTPPNGGEISFDRSSAGPLGEKSAEQVGVPVAVFAHCFTCNKDLKATVRISRALAKSGIAVLRFDMTGLGGSEGDFSQTNFSTNLLDLAAAIEFADRELGPVQVMIGHSFGGVASLITAARRHDSLDLPLDRLRFVATLAAPSDTVHLANLLVAMNPAIESAGQGEVTIGGVRWTIDRQMIDDFRSHDVTDELAKIDCPVLLMHSPVDETVGIDQAIRLMSLIQTRRDGQPHDLSPVSLVVLPDADHLLVKNPADIQFVSQMISVWGNRFCS